jgi:hypothetical protein
MNRYYIHNLKLVRTEVVWADSLNDAITYACKLYDWRREDCIDATKVLEY